MIVINDTLGAYGGSHTLMLRMCQWMSKNGIEATIICKEDSNTEIVNKLKSLNIQIVRADLADYKNGVRILNKLNGREQIKMINFSWNNYLDVEVIKKKYHLEFDNMLYCIHPETFKKGVGFRNKILKAYSKASYRKIFERMNNNRAIISLDEINISESEKYLECSLSKKPKIIRLPMFCEERSDYNDIISKGFDSQTILTAARADFPYKGYMIGLIEDYSILKRNYPNLKLEIVSSGDDYNQLIDKINTIPEAQRRDIILHGWMDYERLKEKMRECKVFVGMGTTVFDAALQYKPAIVVRFNTMQNCSDHFVSENPEYMAANVDCNDPAISRLEKTINMNYDEYKSECHSSFDSVKKLYDINKCMQDLVSISTGSGKSLLKKTECLRHVLNHKLNAFRFRNRHFADYNDLIKEEK